LCGLTANTFAATTARPYASCTPSPSPRCVSFTVAVPVFLTCHVPPCPMLTAAASRGLQCCGAVLQQPGLHLHSGAAGIPPSLLPLTFSRLLPFWPTAAHTQLAKPSAAALYFRKAVEHTAVSGVGGPLLGDCRAALMHNLSVAMAAGGAGLTAAKVCASSLTDARALGRGRGRQAWVQRHGSRWPSATGASHPRTCPRRARVLSGSATSGVALRDGLFP
jgi:hypothetical protein